MRTKLGLLEGERMEFVAEIKRFGQKSGWTGTLPTLLLVDVARFDTGEVISDHLWFTAGKWVGDLSEGDVIRFAARVGVYEKGYRGYREDAWDAPEPSLDWRLERPTQVHKRTGNGKWLTVARKPSPPKKREARASVDPPDEPSDAQLSFLRRLREEAGLEEAEPNLESINGSAASKEIDALLKSGVKLRCEGMTKAGDRCRQRPRMDTDYRRCGLHPIQLEE